MDDREENTYDEYVDDSSYEKLGHPTEPESGEQQTDYISHYQSSEDLPVTENFYEYDQQSSASSVSEKGEHPEVKSLGSMADQVVEGIDKLSTEERNRSDSDIPSSVYNESITSENDSSTGQRSAPKIALFIKAGSDSECLGCCPFSQRLFMMLWLKGVVFQVTTVDRKTKPKQLSDIAVGMNPPYLLFNNEELTDVQKCEDYIEAELYPPRYPKLACKHAQSNTVGNDIFSKFSIFVKFDGNPNDPRLIQHEKRLNNELRKLDKYLNEPLDDEIDEGADDDEPQVSTRKFIDGNQMTIADCNMLPKLNMIRVAAREFRDYEIPAEFTGIARYLAAADEMEEFKQTCPNPDEICKTYEGNRRRKPRKK